MVTSKFGRGGAATPAADRAPAVAATRAEAIAAAERFAQVVLTVSVDVGSYAEQRALRDALAALAAAAVRLPV